jgi:hypothetical protein
LRKEEELNGVYEDEVQYVPPVYEERRFKPRNEPAPTPARADSDDGYMVNDQSEPFEFEATQAPPQPQIEEQVIAKPASKVKKINPFATKPKDPSFLLSSTATPLGGLKAVAKALAPTIAAVAAPQKRKQMGIMAFASVNAEKKVKASENVNANTALEVLKEKKASGSSFVPKVTVKDHFAAVAESIAEKEAVFVPNKSIIPENETEEERIKREGIEMMFMDDNKENPQADPKGKGPANPKSLLKNQGWAEEDQQIIN